MIEGPTPCRVPATRTYRKRLDPVRRIRALVHVTLTQEHENRDENSQLKVKKLD